VPTPENTKEAKKRKLGRSLQPWTKSAASLVDLAVSAVSLILAYTDGGFINGITKGVLNKMYKITSAQNNPVAIVCLMSLTTSFRGCSSHIPGHT
jgi:hypothetical protein